MTTVFRAHTGSTGVVVGMRPNPALRTTTTPVESLEAAATPAIAATSPVEARGARLSGLALACRAPHDLPWDIRHSMSLVADRDLDRAEAHRADVLGAKVD